MRKPTRTALLIASQTPTGAHLEGIRYDIERIKEFLLSPFGGAWLPHEIIVLINPSCSRVLKYVQSIDADYAFIYFSGHGSTINKTDRKIGLIDGRLSDTQLFSPSLRQFTFVDACRTHIEPPRISGIELFPGDWTNCSGHVYARHVFNSNILSSPAGRTLYHATGDNQPAYEDLRRKGGKCSLALLDAVHHYQHLKMFGTVSYQVAFLQARQLLAQRGTDQRPEAVIQTGNLTVPFAMVSPSFVPLPRHDNQESALGTMLTLTTVGLLLYGLSDH